MIRLLIVTFVLLPISSFATPVEPERDALVEKWINGYLYDFREHVKFIEGRTPMVVEIYDYSKKKTKVIESTIEDRDLIIEIIKMVVEDVERKTKEENWIEEDGTHKGRRTIQSHAYPSIKLKWYFDGLLAGFRFDANGIECFSKFDSKKSQVLYFKRSCSPDLGTKIKERLQIG